MDGDAGRGDGYVLDDQIGFLLRRANQRHLGIFNAAMTDGLTAQQFAVLVRIEGAGEVSQNEVGRRTAMDQSTINGVVQRLLGRGLVAKARSPTDRRVQLLRLTEDGRAVLGRAVPVARAITAATLEPLDAAERDMLRRLLRRIAG